MKSFFIFSNKVKYEKNMIIKIISIFEKESKTSISIGANFTFKSDKSVNPLSRYIRGSYLC